MLALGDKLPHLGAVSVTWVR